MDSSNEETSQKPMDKMTGRNSVKSGSTSVGVKSEAKHYRKQTQDIKYWQWTVGTNN